MMFDARLLCLRTAGGPAAAVLLATLAGCGAAPAAREEAPPPPEVGVVTPVERVIAEWETYTGRLEAVDRVEVRPRVTGFVRRTHFDEGAMVRRGALLYTLDPRTFEAARDAARARVDEERARLALARTEAERVEGLIATRAVSREELDQRQRQVDTASAALAEAEAELVRAELDLEFTRVVAPVAGHIGRELVTEGNLVSGGSGDATVLTTIVSDDPIYLRFPLGESAALRIRQGFVHGNATLPVELQLTGEDGFPHTGRLEFLDNRIDEETGTMLARAIFDNADGGLVPGAFGRVRLQLDAPRPRLMVPEQALGTDQTQEVLMIVGEDDVIRRQVVTTGSLRDGWRVIRSGIDAGQRVIVEGLTTARPGTKVTPREVEPQS